MQECTPCDVCLSVTLATQKLSVHVYTKYLHLIVSVWYDACHGLLWIESACLQYKVILAWHWKGLELAQASWLQLFYWETPQRLCENRCKCCLSHMQRSDNSNVKVWPFQQFNAYRRMHSCLKVIDIQQPSQPTLSSNLVDLLVFSALRARMVMLMLFILI